MYNETALVGTALILSDFLCALPTVRTSLRRDNTAMSQ